MALNKLPSLEKYGSSSKTETENTVKLVTKKGSLSLAGSDDKNMEKQHPKEIRIRTNKLARENRSVLSVYASLDGDRIPRKKEKKKLSETSITGNKITQDPDNMSKEGKVGSSIENKNSININTTFVYK